MARTTMVVLTCDLHGDGTEAVTTLKIEASGTRRELDVCQEHLDELMGLTHRPARERRADKKASANGAKERRAGPDPTEIRSWARANGYTVADRGRIPREIVAAFSASKKRKR